MRPITDILREMRKGAIVDRATEELAAVMDAVQDTGKPGALTITLTITPETDRRGIVDKVDITASVTPKIPRADLPKAAFFVTADNDLVRDDPRQSEMFSPVEAGDAHDAPARPRRSR
jgi:hypothetical protein